MNALSLAMSLFLTGSILDSQIIYAFPLIVSVSLVYGATRHEHLIPILKNAFRAATWIVVFMAIIYLVIWFVGWMI